MQSMIEFSANKGKHSELFSQRKQIAHFKQIIVIVYPSFEDRFKRDIISILQK